MESKLKRRILWLLLGAVALIVLLVYWNSRKPVSRVSVVRAARENLTATIFSNGKVEPITPYSLRARYATFVEKVQAVEGQRVKRGQVLLVLDANEARADLAHAREQLLAAADDLRAARAGGRPDDRARVEGDLRKADLERDRLRKERRSLERLFAKQAATQEELDQNRIALEGAEADYRRLLKVSQEFASRTQLGAERAQLLADQFRSQVRDFEEKVRSAQVTAPVDGTLYSLPVRAGDFVKVGDSLAEVADLRRVRVRAFIDEPDLGGLEPNQSVEITWDALPNRIWWGSAEHIPKQVVARGNRSVGELLCAVANDKLELLPNTNVNVRIHLHERQNALVIPRGAVQIEGNRRFVFVVEDGGLGVGSSRLHKREIKIGIASAANYEVLDGLREGETVALPGDTELLDGERVRVVQAG